MSYSVSRRTNEIGIRMALGAQRSDVLRLVMRESMILVVIGVVIGLAIALASGQFVATLLFGLPPTDPMIDRARRRRDGAGVGARRLPAGAPRRRASIRWWRCTTSSGAPALSSGTRRRPNEAGSPGAESARRERSLRSYSAAAVSCKG